MLRGGKGAEGHSQQKEEYVERHRDLKECGALGGMALHLVWIKDGAWVSEVHKEVSEDENEKVATPGNE